MVSGLNAILSKNACWLLLLASFAFHSDSSRSIYLIPRSPWLVCCGDIDLDGDNDIITGHSYNSITKWSGISLLKNDGSGNFFSYPMGFDSSKPDINNESLNCFPNPFSIEINIQMDLQRNADVVISISDLQGRLIRSITERKLSKGNHSFTWDGCNDNGNACMPGIYLLNLKVDGKQSQTIKLIKL